MPRVTFVKAARKDNPVCKKGESYFWWKFRYGGKRYSLVRPRPSQLTQSAYYGSIRSLSERVDDFYCTEYEEFESLKDEVIDELQNIGQECQDGLDNMPESLQYSPTGELLQERIDACENGQSEAEGIEEFEFEEEDFEREDFDGDEDDDDAEAAHEAEQDEAEAAHEEAEEARKDSEFSDWFDGAKDELTSAVSECEV